MSAYNEVSGVTPELSIADVIIQQTCHSINLLDKTHDVFMEQFEDRLFPCNIARDGNGKKRVALPKGWADSNKEFDDFDSAHANSMAVRTGKLSQIYLTLVWSNGVELNLPNRLDNVTAGVKL